MNSPLNKPLKFHAMNIIIRSVSEEGSKIYSQVFLDETTVRKRCSTKKIDVLEGINTNETSASKECMLCHYYYFKDVRFEFEHVCL